MINDIEDYRKQYPKQYCINRCQLCKQYSYRYGHDTQGYGHTHIHSLISPILIAFPKVLPFVPEKFISIKATESHHSQNYQRSKEKYYPRPKIACMGLYLPVKRIVGFIKGITYPTQTAPYCPEKRNYIRTECFFVV